MWSRKELKTKARKNLKKNYWVAVAICFVLAFIGAEYSDSVDIIHQNSNSVNNLDITKNITKYEQNDEYESGDTVEVMQKAITEAFQNITASTSWIFKICAGGMFIVAAIVSLLFIFGVVYPIMVGARRFFIKNQYTKPNFLELFGVFHHYKEYFNIVYNMFCKFLFTYLWALLFIIPGIIKNYEYRMVPFILAENPNIRRKRVFEISKKMMKGQKWKTFVLDLSFMGWRILSSISCGIVGIFYANPYTSATFAELYTKLKDNVIDSNIVREDEIKKTPFEQKEVEV